MVTVPVDTERFGAMRVDSVAAKLNPDGTQRRDRRTSLPLWVVRVLRRPSIEPFGLREHHGPVDRHDPAVAERPGECVRPGGIRHHLDNGRSGPAFRVDSIEEA